MQETAEKSKSGRGGKRQGAGRKPSTIKGIVKLLPGDSAKLILAEIKAKSKWVKLSQSDDERIVFEVLRYLTDRAHGKPTQRTEMVLGGLYDRMTPAEKDQYATDGTLPDWFKAAAGLEEEQGVIQ